MSLILMLGSTQLRAESLLELWEHVVASNPTLRSSEHAVEQARAQQDQVFAKMLPNAGIKGYYGYNSYNRDVNGQGFNLYGKGNQEYAGYYGSLQISQALFDLPSYLRHQGADKQTQQQEQYALAQRMQIAYKLVDGYLTILEADDVIDQLDAEFESTQAQLQRMRHMHESQLVKVTDLYEVEAYSQALETSRIEAQHSRAIATEKLREITGVHAENPDPLVQEDFPDVKRGADEWVEEAMSSNPLLLSLEYGSEAAQQMIASAQAEHLPTLSATLSETISNTITNNLEVLPYNIGTAALNINIPLYAGGAIEAGVKEQVQKYQATREKIEEARRGIEKDTRSAWLNVVSGHSRIDSSRKEADFREKAKTAQQTSYELGAATIVAVLDAHRRLLKARTDFHKAKYDFIRSLIALRLNSGSLADLDIESVSPWFAPLASKDQKAPNAERIQAAGINTPIIHPVRLTHQSHPAGASPQRERAPTPIPTPAPSSHR